MSETVKMPALGESVTEGTVTRWLKEVGETVEVDEPLLEVSTDKVDTEIPSPVAGVLQKILVPEDEDAEVGADLAIVGDSADDASGPAPETPAAPEAAPEPEAESAPAASPEPAPAPSPEPAASPAPAPASGGQEVPMPALGESVTEGTVTRWLKEVGETVEVDEPLLEVSTDKVDTEIPSPVAGVLQKILVPEDEDAEVGAPLAIIGDSAAEAPAPAPEPEPAPAPAPEPAPEPASAPTPPPAPAAKEPTPAPAPAARTEAPAPAAGGAISGSGSEAGYVTPLVRKLASSHGIDLASVKGTGIGGRIRKQDVQTAIDEAEKAKKAEAERAAQQKAPAPSAPAEKPAKAPAPEVSSLRGTEEKMSRLRKIVATRMVDSLQSMAQLTTAVEVDMTRVARLRAAHKDEFLARERAKLTFLPFITLAAVEALKTYPQINASVDAEKIIYHGEENVGIAADTPRGLVVPVIKRAGDLNLAGIAKQIGDLGGRAKSNKLGPDDLQGATFTITNTGAGGALFDTPIVPAPQVAILGCGTIVKRPAVIPSPEGDVIAIRQMMYLFLSYDHRLVDGGDAARYLTAVKKRLEDADFGSDL